MSAGKPRILLIDDEHDLVHVWSLWLQARGYDVDTVCDPEEGFQLAITNPPDVILLDIAMPKLDGWTLCQQLRADESTAQTPIIIITAVANPGVKERAADVGANNILIKPFNEDSLAALICEYLSADQRAALSA